ncbi:MAG: sensor domain-containing diguanylate cyclase [Cellvibrionaceae bacterium]
MYGQREELQKVRRNWLGVSLAVIVLLIFSSCIQFYLSYQQHLKVIDDNLETLSLTLIKQAEAEFRSAEIALRFAREKIQQAELEQAAGKKLDADSVYKIFLDVVSTFNQTGTNASPHDLFWVDAAGLVRTTSYSNPTPEISAQDRFYFSFHRQNASSVVLYSGSMQSRLTNRWVVFQTVRLDDENGNFRGVIGITTRTDAFETFYKQLDLNEGSSIILASLQGQWSYRFPFDEKATAINFTKEKTFSAIRAKPRGKFILDKSPYDGHVRRAGFTWTDSQELVAIVTFTNEATKRGFYPVLRQRGLLLVAMVAILFVFVWAYNRVYRRTDEAMRLATIDELTEIPNRRYFEERFLQEWRSLLRKKEALGVLYIDIDYFKKYNDQYGHAAGDLCLKNVANIIKASLKRPDDFVARYGGEEFIVLLPGNDYEQTQLVADEILNNVRDAKFLHIASRISSYLTVSVGFTSMIPDGDDEGRALIRRADRALYMAKNNGRDQACGLNGTDSTD